MTGSDTFTAEQAEELFWDLADELRAGDARLAEGRIMSSRCLRVDGEFLAMVHHREPGMVVKLPRERVTELIATGQGEPFAPNGRVFTEWLAVRTLDEARWRALLREGIEFVAP